MTGEFIDGIQSSMTRMITLNIDKNQVNNDILSYYQNNYKILPTHIYDFLDYIRCNYNNTVKYIKQRIPEIRKQASTYFHIPRYAKTFAQFVCVAEIFLSYALYHRFISDLEYTSYCKEFTDSIHRVILKNDFNVIVKNPATMFLMALQSSIDNGKIMCRPLSDAKQNMADCIYISDDFMYIKPDTALILAKMYWRDLDIHFPATSTDSLTQHLVSKEVIRREYEGTALRASLKLPGRSKNDNRRFYKIILSKMNEMLTEAHSF